MKIINDVTSDLKRGKNECCNQNSTFRFAVSKGKQIFGISFPIFRDYLRAVLKHNTKLYFKAACLNSAGINSDIEDGKEMQIHKDKNLFLQRFTFVKIHCFSYRNLSLRSRVRRKCTGKLHICIQ